jgi:hypothetical protein
MNIPLIGLIVFVIVQALNAMGLGLDLALDLHGIPTISSVVWSGTPLGNVIGLGILFLQELGVGGLMLHFYWR